MGKYDLTIQQETKIVALLARGDMYQEIIEAFKGERPLTNATISAVKKRNKENLELITQRQLEKEEADALAVKQKANKMIAKKLDQSDQNQETLDKANERYASGKITHKEYLSLTKHLKPVTIPELVSVSREMHTQSSAEPPKQDAHKDLQSLVAAIREGDEVELSKIVFRSKDDLGDPSTEEPQSLISSSIE
jgi:hypothetical protein